MNSNKRIAATLYSLGTVCLRNIGINVLHKGDDDDDDDDDDDNDDNNNNKLGITNYTTNFDAVLSRTIM